jgi:hypothetical protein
LRDGWDPQLTSPRDVLGLVAKRIAERRAVATLPGSDDGDAA